MLTLVTIYIYYICVTLYIAQLYIAYLYICATQHMEEGEEEDKPVPGRRDSIYMY